MISKITESPLLVRVVPFAVFIVLTACQGQFGEAGRYWFYLAKTLAGAAILWAVRPFLAEMKWKISWEAVVVGVAVFIMWAGLDVALVKLGFADSYPKMKLTVTAWNPHEHFGDGAALAWFFIAVRLLGSALIVPPLEEVFFRSFSLPLHRQTGLPKRVLGAVRLDAVSRDLGDFRCGTSRMAGGIFAASPTNGWSSANSAWATR